jgi:hypothetical protein
MRDFISGKGGSADDSNDNSSSAAHAGGQSNKRRIFKQKRSATSADAAAASRRKTPVINSDNDDVDIDVCEYEDGYMDDEEGDEDASDVSTSQQVELNQFDPVDYRFEDKKIVELRGDIGAIR